MRYDEVHRLGGLYKERSYAPNDVAIKSVYRSGGGANLPHVGDPW